MSVRPLLGDVQQRSQGRAPARVLADRRQGAGATGLLHVAAVLSQSPHLGERFSRGTSALPDRNGVRSGCSAMAAITPIVLSRAPAIRDRAAEFGDYARLSRLELLLLLAAATI